MHTHNQSCVVAHSLPAQYVARLPAVNPHRLSRYAWKDARAAEQKKTAKCLLDFFEANKEQLLKQADGVWTAAISLAAKTWNRLSKDDQAPYKEKAEAAKKQHEKDMKGFTNGGGVTKQCKASPATKRRDNKKRGQKNKQKDGAGASQKPVGGAYGCFLSAVWPLLQKASKGDPIGAAVRQASR